jgi:hypothetical protein
VSSDSALLRIAMIPNHLPSSPGSARLAQAALADVSRDDIRAVALSL